MKTIEVINGAFTGRTLEGAEAARQRIEHRLRMIKGKWPLDPSVGFDWLGILGIPGLTGESVESLLRNYLLNDPVVDAVTELNVTVTNRDADITFIVETSEGTIQGAV